MRTADFDYELSPERIAQHPLAARDDSRLMVLERESGEIEHRRFRELDGMLRRGDLLVLNDTRVLPARLVGRKPSGGRVELLLLERAGGSCDEPIWRCWIRASRQPAPDTRIAFAAGLYARVLGREGTEWTVRLESDAGPAAALLEHVGRMPLPPYIRRGDESGPPVDDDERYQTVYSRRPGAVAAPTAGLHFTPALLEGLQDRGVEREFLTLHVGAGTFQPVRTERVERHSMHEEWFELPDGLAKAIDRARRRGGRVVAVGTTVVRVLEHRAIGDGRVAAGSGRCALFIYPGFRFRVVDAMITNFHLPRSTLLMLVCAFAGRSRLLAAYRDAVEHGYRFYSYGDAMFIGAR